MPAYASHALQYLDGAIGYPIPSAYPYEKFPPIIGWTGIEGATPDEGQVRKWMDSHPDSNILLRLNHDVVGIDVDNYADKRGGLTLEVVEGVHGELPETIRSSARHDDPISGIRFYKLRDYMDEREFKGDFGPRTDIEVIRFSHRYAVVEPSWHSGVNATYRWDADLPTIGDLPYLPLRWYTHITQSCECFLVSRLIYKRQMKRYASRTSTPEDKEQARKDFKDNLITLADMPAGSRNNYLSGVAGRTFLFDVFLAGALDEGEVIDRLQEAAEGCGLDNHEANRTIKSAYDYALRESENT